MEFPAHLLTDPLREQLRVIHERNLSKMEECRLCLDLVSCQIQQLRSYRLEAEPMPPALQLAFQRELLPPVYAELLFYLQRYQMELRLCYHTREERARELQLEQQRCLELLRPQRELLSYYRSGARFLDVQYFRPEDGSVEWPAPAPQPGEPSAWAMATVLCTPAGFRIAKALALERFVLLLDESGPQPDTQLQEPLQPYSQGELNWTASKTDLVELLYAMYSTGVLNHASLELHRLMERFETLFQVNLGNYSRVFQQIRIRKKNRTSFLDQMRDQLLRHMDELEE